MTERAVNLSRAVVPLTQAAAVAGSIVGAAWWIDARLDAIEAGTRARWTLHDMAHWCARIAEANPDWRCDPSPYQIVRERGDEL